MTNLRGRLEALAAYLDRMDRHGAAAAERSGLTLAAYAQVDVSEALALLTAAEGSFRTLLHELEWVNEQLDLMPDDYAEALSRAASVAQRLKEALSDG